MEHFGMIVVQGGKLSSRLTLVLAETVTIALFTMAPLLLVLADATATAVFAQVPLALVLAELL